MTKLISIDKFLEANDIGESSLRKVVKKDDFPKVLVGNRVLIINDAVTEWLIKHQGEDITKWVEDTLIKRVWKSL